MRWRNHLACDLEITWSGFLGFWMTLCAMFFGTRTGSSSVKWRGMLWNVETRKGPKA